MVQEGEVLEKYMINFNVLLGITYIIYVHPNLNKVFKVSIDIRCPNQLYLLPIAKNHIINGGQHCLAPEGTIIVVIIKQVP